MTVCVPVVVFMDEVIAYKSGLFVTSNNRDALSQRKFELCTRREKASGFSLRVHYLGMAYL